VCLRLWEWSETSQTLAALTREHGLVRALAKGSRRPKAPFSGGIEVLTRGDLGLILKAPGKDTGSDAGSGLAVATSWDLLETFPALRTRLHVHYAGMFVADAVLHAVTDHDPHPGLYDAATQCLRSLGAAEDGASTSIPLVGFLWALLTQTGYRPQVLEVGEAGEAGARLVFDPDAGTLGPGKAAMSDAQQAWPVRPGTAAVMRALAGGGDADEHAGESVDRAARLLAAYLRHLIGREPPTMPLVFGRIPWGRRSGKTG
jgi:DNA repair protein RecO (recombination protein O)